MRPSEEPFAAEVSTYSLEKERIQEDRKWKRETCERMKPEEPGPKNYLKSHFQNLIQVSTHSGVCNQQAR